jgi:hypothetical protein
MLIVFLQYATGGAGFFGGSFLKGDAIAKIIDKNPVPPALHTVEPYTATLQRHTPKTGKNKK